MLRAYGMEVFGRYYGLYRGIVKSNEDPEGRGRVQVCVPQVGHWDQYYPSIWVEPMTVGSGPNRGVFWPPEKGDPVWVSFEMGAADTPQAYIGGWYAAALDDKTDRPKEFDVGSTPPTARGWVTRMGHVVQFVDEPGKEAIRIIWHKAADDDPARNDASKTADRTKGAAALLTFTEKSILLMNQNGTLLELSAEDKAFKVIDENSNVLTSDDEGWKMIAKDGSVISLVDGVATVIASKGLTVTGESVTLKAAGVMLADGADTPAVRGQDLMTWLASHTHGTGVGPSTPPTSPPPSAILSQKVKLK